MPKWLRDLGGTGLGTDAACNRVMEHKAGQAVAYDYDRQRWVADPAEARRLLVAQAVEELAVIHDPAYQRLVGLTPEQARVKASFLATRIATY